MNIKLEQKYPLSIKIDRLHEAIGPFSVADIRNPGCSELLFEVFPALVNQFKLN